MIEDSGQQNQLTQSICGFIRSQFESRILLKPVLGACVLESVISRLLNSHTIFVSLV